MVLGSEDLHSTSSSAMTELANSEKMSTSPSLNSFTYKKIKGLDYIPRLLFRYCLFKHDSMISQNLWIHFI